MPQIGHSDFATVSLDFRLGEGPHATECDHGHRPALPADRRTEQQPFDGRGRMSEHYPAAVEQVAKDFIAALKASVPVRRYAAAYLDHLLQGGPEPQEFKVEQGQPSFGYLRRRIDRILNEQDT